MISQASHDGIGIVGLLAAIPFVFGAVALYTTARLADRAPEPQMRYIAGPLVLSGVALIVQHFVSAGLWINITLLCVCALGIFAPFGPWWAWVLRMAPRNQVGSAGGVVNAIGNLGGIVGPIVVGAAATGGDLRNGFYVLGVALLLAAGIAVWLNGICRDRPAREASSAAQRWRRPGERRSAGGHGGQRARRGRPVGPDRGVARYRSGRRPSGHRTIAGRPHRDPRLRHAVDR